MALKKAIGFNHAKTWADTVAVLGGKKQVVQFWTTNDAYDRLVSPAKGAFWDVKNGGTLQRYYRSASGGVYPHHSGTSDYSSAIMDFGRLGDFHAAGGFCVTARAKYSNPGIGFLYTLDGVNIRSVLNTSTYSDSNDFYTWSAAVTVPGSATQRPWTEAYTANLKVAENGEVLMATGGRYMAKWNSAANPTANVYIEAVNVGYTDATWRSGFYYYTWYNSFNQAGAVVYRSATWGTGTPTIVYSPGGLPSNLDWFPQAGCFIYTGQNASGFIVIGRSVDGTSWTTVFTGTGTQTGQPLSLGCSDDGQTMVVSAAGIIMVSSDGGVTWTQRTSPVAFGMSCVKFYEGEWLGFCVDGSTMRSTDNGATWVNTPRVVWNSAVEGNSLGWRFLPMNDGLYAFRVSNQTSSSVMKYLGAGVWENIQSIYQARLAYGSASNVYPLGTFFADAFTGTGLLTGGNNMYGATMFSNGIWTTVQGSGSTWPANTQASVSVDDSWHRIQIVGSAGAGATFDIEIWVDGIKQGATIVGATPTSMDQHLWFCTSSYGFDTFQDIIVNDFSGTSMNDIPRGDVQVRPRSTGFTTDVGTPAWERVPTGAASNAAAASGDGAVVGATSFVQSSAVGDEDTYRNAGAVAPFSGYRIAAVNTSMVFNRLGIPTPTVEFDVAHNGTSLSSQALVLDGSTADFVGLNLIDEKDSNGNLWTEATLQAMQVSINRTA